jgi:hypothetical protein
VEAPDLRVSVDDLGVDAEGGGVFDEPVLEAGGLFISHTPESS